ncbi:hypothetical protein [Rubinisphaera italica]|uniref:Phage head-tail joining protein domain-containing protein n=1 Tax=Rubinisphaera italica TaxID=2527969 RepID=A0A5C5XL76_9PLAN|nr:hypothetical protein [Rubinisphaera italica]TWT63191.1 hypothetical protein Pan54_39440 [Rubinisphaera italica]
MSVEIIAARVSRRAHKKLNGFAVLYKRGELTCSPIATVGNTRRDQQFHDGHISRKQIRDFLIDAAELIIDNIPVEPELDDLIEETVGDRVYVYRVVSPGGNEEPFRYSDRHRLTWRLHVELIEERDVE